MADVSSHSTSPATDDFEMADQKAPRYEIGEKTVSDDVDNDPAFEGTKSAPEDRLDMNRMGKQQQLIRHFRLLSTVSFVAMATAAWEIGIFLTTQGLVDGGRAGLVWSVVWNFVGFCPIYLSMAEMASMAPTA